MSKSLSDMKVAIVHDWLIGGGAERVVLELHKLFPKAPIYTAFCNDSSKAVFKNADVRTSYMQNFPFSKLRKLLPILRQYWFERLNLREYDLVISSSGAEAKGVKNLRHSALHINYCHSPTHYYWVRSEEYLENPGLGKLDPLARMGLTLLLKSSKRWDYRAAQRPKYMIANSHAVQERIQEFYNRESTVIYPPVDTERFASSHPKPRAGFVVAGRQTPYKRIDLAVIACTQAELPLTVIGRGPEHRNLRKLAGPTISFKTDVDDKEIAGYFQSAAAFIFPNEDDFGITPVEAMAAGTPVIAYKAGGALDYVIPGKTGEFFSKQTPEDLAKVLVSFQPEKYKHELITDHAQQFSQSVFADKLLSFVENCLKEV